MGVCKKVDSSVDCHADKSARNDRESRFFIQDSRDCGGAVDFHRLPRPNKGVTKWNYTSKNRT